MPNLIKIHNQQEYKNLVKFLSKRRLSLFNSKSKKQSFIRKSQKKTLINERSYIITANKEPLEYLNDFDNENKKRKIQEVHLASYRGRDELYFELKNRYYNIKIEDINIVLNECLICSQRTVVDLTENIEPIMLSRNFERF